MRVWRGGLGARAGSICAGAFFKIRRAACKFVAKISEYFPYCQGINFHAKAVLLFCLVTVLHPGQPGELWTEAPRSVPEYLGTKVQRYMPYVSTEARALWSLLCTQLHTKSFFMQPRVLSKIRKKYICIAQANHIACYFSLPVNPVIPVNTPTVRSSSPRHAVGLPAAD